MSGIYFFFWFGQLRNSRLFRIYIVVVVSKQTPKQFLFIKNSDTIESVKQLRGLSGLTNNSRNNNNVIQLKSIANINAHV